MTYQQAMNRAQQAYEDDEITREELDEYLTQCQVERDELEN